MPKPKRNLEATNTPPESPVNTTAEDPFGESPIPQEAGPDPFGDALVIDGVSIRPQGGNEAWTIRFPDEPEPEIDPFKDGLVRPLLDALTPAEPLPLEPVPGEDPGSDDPPDEGSIEGAELAAAREADRLAAIDEAVRGANDRLFETRPPAQPLSFSPTSIDLDATLKAPWSNGALPGWATVKANLKARITSASQAADLEEHLPGAGFVFRCGTPPEGIEPRDMHLHWTPTDDLLDWSIVQMGEIVAADHPKHAKIKGQAAVKSLTLTSASGTVMFSIGVHIEVQVASLADVDALNGQVVRVKARLAQGKLA